jgi:hypothetical protein
MDTLADDLVRPITLFFTEVSTCENTTNEAANFVKSLDDQETACFTCSIVLPCDHDARIGVMSVFDSQYLINEHKLAIDLESICSMASSDAVYDPLRCFLKASARMWRKTGIWVVYGHLSDAKQQLGHAHRDLSVQAVHFGFGTDKQIFTRGLKPIAGQELEFINNTAEPDAVMYNALVAAYYVLLDGPFYEQRHSVEQNDHAVLVCSSHRGAGTVKIKRQIM